MNRNSDQILFVFIDDHLAQAAEAIKNKLLSQIDISLTPAQYKNLQPLIRQELNFLIWRILGSFDNVGCILPEDVDGFRIVDKKDDTDIRLDDADYADM